jgi:serine/threonine-protein kinase
MVGQKIAQYQILEQLGSGGMGDIYKAQDLRLNRVVAIKVLSQASAGDPERRRRFILEAQAASALNHPNIITIHDIISLDNSEYMVMEYVQGQTLVDLIPKGGLRMPLALKYAVQMTEALAAAHQAGIVHRDLKPANVMVTENGLVKILDFGLAKLTDAGPVATIGADQTQTLAKAPLTVEGSIIGTVSYMSPEQAQGRKVDTRSDIFSFGVVLYEMVTGARAFGGDNAVSTLSAILRDEARPITEVAPDVPPQIEQVVKRCLRKNPDDRWQSMQDVRAALAALKHESDSGQLYRSRIGAPAPKSGGSRMWLGIAAAVIVLGGAGGGLRWFRRHHARPPEQQVQQVPPAQPAPEQAAPPVAATEPAPEPAAQEPAAAAAPAEVALTNDHIIDMVQAKVATQVILSQIRSSKTDFNLSPAELIRLTKAGVPAVVIETMRNPKAAPTSVAVASKSTKTAAPPQQTSTPAAAPQPVPVSTPVAPPPAPAPAPVTAAPPPANSNKATATIASSIPDGTPVRLALSADIPGDATEGQAIRFTVVDPIRGSNGIVIGKGAVVTGEIVDASKKKFLGIGGGKMQYRLTGVTAVDGHKLNIRATPSVPQDGFAKRSVENPNQKHTKEVAAFAGAEYIGYIDGDQTVQVKK